MSFPFKKSFIALVLITPFAIIVPTLSAKATQKKSSSDPVYSVAAVQTQYHNWMLVNQSSTTGLISGGYVESGGYTSEGLGFEVLLSAGILNLTQPGSTEYQQAAEAIANVYRFITNQGASRLVGGLLPWAFDSTLKATSQASATDADTYLAAGFYLAGKSLNNADYTNLATAMMQAMYKYDTTTVNGVVVGLNEGGANATGTPVVVSSGPFSLAYSKTNLDFLTAFAKADTKDNWNGVIVNSLQAMSTAQNAAMSGQGVPVSQWGGVLGFIDQTTPGEAYFTFDGQNFTFDAIDTGKSWSFNYDGGRTPLFLGQYLLNQCSKSSNNCTIAQTLLQNEMEGLNKVFYNATAAAYLVNLPISGATGPGSTSAYIYQNGAAITPPTQSGSNAYADDFLNSVFLIGNLGANGWGENPNTLNPATSTAISVMSSSSGSYYDAAYKIFTGLLLSNGFGNTVNLQPNNFVMNQFKAPTPFDENTRVVLVLDKREPWYEDYKIQPAMMEANQTYKIVVKAQGATSNLGFQTQAWGGGNVSVVSSTENCAVISVSTSRPDYQDFGLIGVTGVGQDPSAFPTLVYDESATSCPAN